MVLLREVMKESFKGIVQVMSLSAMKIFGMSALESTVVWNTDQNDCGDGRFHETRKSPVRRSSRIRTQRKSYWTLGAYLLTSIFFLHWYLQLRHCAEVLNGLLDFKNKYWCVSWTNVNAVLHPPWGSNSFLGNTHMRSLNTERACT